MHIKNVRYDWLPRHLERLSRGGLFAFFPTSLSSQMRTRDPREGSSASPSRETAGPLLLSANCY